MLHTQQVASSEFINTSRGNTMSNTRILTICALCLSTLVGLSEIKYYFSHPYHTGIAIHLIALSVAVILIGIAQHNIQITAKRTDFSNALINNGVIKAQSFKLVNSEGNTCGEFTTIENEPRLSLWDLSTGVERGVFCMHNGDTGLVLLDSSGNQRGMFNTVYGEPRLALSDEEGKMRGLFSTINGDPGLDLWDEKGKRRGLFSTIGGEPRLALWNAEGNMCGELGTISGKPKLVLYNSAGNIIWETK